MQDLKENIVKVLKINKYFIDACEVDVKHSDDKVVIIVLYVDDLIITRDHTHNIEITKDQLKQAFEITDLGLMHYFLGMQVWQEEGRIMLSQTKYALDVLKKFNMSDCKPSNTPCEARLKLSANSTQKKVDTKLYRQLVGSLFYLTITRPDIAYAVGIVSKYMAVPHMEHWKAVKRILKYIKGTYQLGIEYKYGGEPILVGYTIMIMQVTLMIENQPQDTFFILDPNQFLGATKSNQQCHYHPQRLNILVHQRHLKKHCGLEILLEEIYHPLNSPTIIFCDNQIFISS
jgi:hypothetical protein